MVTPRKLLTRIRKTWAYGAARRRRQGLGSTVFVGVTGTSGKSTATGLAAAILRTAGPCAQTRGYNALGDLVRLLRSMGPAQRYCVAELAAFGPGTLDRHVALIAPDIAVVTVIGREHYKAYRHLDAVAAEKAKVVLAPPQDGVAVLNIDDPLVRAIGERTSRRVLWFGCDAAATLRLVQARSAWPESLTLVVAWGGAEYVVGTRLHGRHLAVPVLAALGAGLAAGVPIAAALAAIAAFEPAAGRMQPLAAPDGITWMRDDMKSPAWSLALPFEWLREARAPRRVAIIGTVSDTHGDSGRNYRDFGRMARTAADLVVFVGPLAHRGLRARETPDDPTVQAFPTAQAAAAWLRTELRAGDLVLMKASHKADHLVRVILDREQPISCWRERCEQVRFCDQCPELRAARTPP
ncbi:MAG: hypothetical protein IT486_08845 [Gammaproteobacteria bacterium]|nr:hypothetical protein [Gammaproteobacteria bacterium]